MITITLNEIRASNPCNDAWEAKALAYLHRDKIDDTPVTFAQIIESCGLDDAIYCLRCLPEAERWRVRLFSRSCAARVLHLWDAPQVVKEFLRTGENARGAGAAAEREWQAQEILRIMELPDVPESRIIELPEALHE